MARRKRVRTRKKLALSRRSARRRNRSFDFAIETTIAKEIWAVLYVSVAALTYLSIKGSLGEVGEIWKGMLLPIFGYGIYFLPILFLGIAIILFFLKQVQFGISRVIGIFLLLTTGLAIVHLSVPLSNFYSVALDGRFGGLVGFVTAFILISIFGKSGAYITAMALFLVAVLLTFQVSLANIITAFFRVFLRNRRRTIIDAEVIGQHREVIKKELDIIKPEALPRRAGSLVGAYRDQDERDIDFELDSTVNIKDEDKSSAINFDDLVEFEWEFPSLDLLSDATLGATVQDAVLKKNAKLISDKLAQFDIDVIMNTVNVGPTVIQYTLKPHAGVKLSKITNLKSDLALALAAKAIRIEAPIPGQSMVGIEIPNDNRSTVRLREILECKEFRVLEDPLKLPIGRDVSGNPVVASLAKMPHLLIAGATGAGKSVGVNSFLIALLYQYSPKDLKFIMIDPKRVELNNYNAIPHLLTPVITEPDKANIALRWCVREMNDRYRRCAEAGHRNIADYNGDMSIKRKMPFIIVVIDELADLMMTVGKEVEASICRIAQMARAVGIHLILATQRPSVDVITGLIKANIPARIAFTVASQVDSRTIIDTIGAEDLLGHGDMLFLPGNIGRPFRVQGTFVSSKEIERVTNRVKLTREPDYIEEIVSDEVAKESIVGIPNSSAGSAVASDEDNIYEDAVKVVLETRKASASYLQRRLSIGYARAARLLDLMEQNGIVGPTRGAKPRDVYGMRE